MNNNLYAITDTQLLPGDRLFSAVIDSLKGGCKLIQYRDKSTDKERRFFEASKLISLCNQYQANLVINDDVELAQEAQAHGVHLGQSDTNPIAARIILGSQAIIGVTCHNSLGLAKKAIADSANYIAFGRFFTSNTKPDAQAVSLDLLINARKQFPDNKIVAIGGITLENAKSVLNAGADIIAVCHALFSAHDIEAQTKRFVEL